MGNHKGGGENRDSFSKNLSRNEKKIAAQNFAKQSASEQVDLLVEGIQKVVRQLQDRILKLEKSVAYFEGELIVQKKNKELKEEELKKVLAHEGEYKKDVELLKKELCSKQTEIETLEKGIQVLRKTLQDRAEEENKKQSVMTDVEVEKLYLEIKSRALDFRSDLLEQKKDGLVASPITFGISAEAVGFGIKKSISSFVGSFTTDAKEPTLLEKSENVSSRDVPSQIDPKTEKNILPFQKSITQGKTVSEIRKQEEADKNKLERPQIIFRRLPQHPDIREVTEGMTLQRIFEILERKNVTEIMTMDVTCEAQGFYARTNLSAQETEKLRTLFAQDALERDPDKGRSSIISACYIGANFGKKIELAPVLTKVFRELLMEQRYESALCLMGACKGLIDYKKCIYDVIIEFIKKYEVSKALQMRKVMYPELLFSEKQICDVLGYFQKSKESKEGIGMFLKNYYGTLELQHKIALRKIMSDISQDLQDAYEEFDRVGLRL